MFNYTSVYYIKSMTSTVQSNRRDWETMATLDPLWAILTHKDKRFDKWEKEEFFKTGLTEISDVMTCVNKKCYLRNNQQNEVLDFGCGVGRISRALSSHFKRVTGIDISKTMIKNAHKLNRDISNCSFIAYDGSLPFGFKKAQFDFIYSNITLQHLSSKRMVLDTLSEFSRIIKPGGIVWFQLPSCLSVLGRFHIKSKLYHILKPLGFSDTFLYKTVGLYAFTMLSVPQEEIVKHLEACGFQLLELRNRHSTKTAYIAERLPSDKISIRVVMPVIRGGGGFEVYHERLREALTPLGIEVSIRYFPEFFWLLPSLINLFYRPREHYDIVHTIPDYGYIFRNWGRKYVLTNHHLVFDKTNIRYSSLVQKLYYRFLLKRRIEKSLKGTNQIISVSNYSKSALQTMFHKSSKVIHNGIDVHFYKPSKIMRHDGKKRILFVGNLIKRKGIDIIPKIIERLGAKYELYYTQGLRTNNRIQCKNCYPLGKLTEMELIHEYNKCDMLLHPSRLEGFGYSAAEAMACGKPVIAANSSSLPELIIHGKGGALCKTDDINDFVENIRMIGRNRQLRNNMGVYNRKRIMQLFSLSTMGKQYAELYANLLNSQS